MKWTMLTVAAALSLFAHTASAQPLEKAIFAGGCFWCVESDFDKVPGVVSTVSGYTGGKTKDPTYQQVTAGGTGHYEAVEITYDPAKVSYEALLTAFWHSVDPTDGGGQFCDRGQSYETAVFAAEEKERSVAEASKKAAQKKVDKPIVTPILAAGAVLRRGRLPPGLLQKEPAPLQLLPLGLRPGQQGQGGLGQACL